MAKWRDYRKNLDLIREILETQKEIVFFDTETTGLSTKTAKIIQFAGIKYKIIDKKLVEDKILNMYINPGIHIPEKITEITGITDEMVKDAPFEKEAIEKSIKPFLGDEPNLCGYNSNRYDIPLLTKTYEDNGYYLIVNKRVDILDVARDITVDEKVENKKLSTICEHFGLDTGLTFHDALDDVRATARVFEYAYQVYLEKEEEDNEKMRHLKIPQVKALKFWQGFRGRSRVYIVTNYGEFYYDTFKKEYGKQDETMYKLFEFDLVQLRRDVWAFADVDSDEELVRKVRKGHA